VHTQGNTGTSRPPHGAAHIYVYFNIYMRKFTYIYVYMYTGSTLPEREHVHTRGNTGKSRPSTLGSTHICMFIYMYVYVYVYIYTKIHICLRACVYICTDSTLPEREHVHTQRNMGKPWPSTRGSTHICMYLYIYVYVYICIYMKIHIHLRACVCMYGHSTLPEREHVHTRGNMGKSQPPHGAAHIYVCFNMYMYMYIYIYI